ncbi:hypothetical protein NSZ01_01030 [Nocardioides szechwanensis]|uniref:hypothetical protein n=1 Tax=Nocardioides szechwanensis TaxID=1005944 RepID=UPI0011957F12|nr:hypothetical protein [Nocardioides szechwanensis]GEP32335.1 hypothetical protein NSZ01_01030 [Nocardioides szechwanensis]
MAYGERVARRLQRFAAVPDGAQVWTRVPAGPFHRGWLTGPWSYDGSSEAASLDLVNVRPCAWDPEPWDEHLLPAAVAHAFRRGGRNFQQIRAATYHPPPGKYGTLSTRIGPEQVDCVPYFPGAVHS